jgi:hypothetical protein
LLRRWSNFLLACPYCNSIKGKKRVHLHRHLWPDRDNTARAFTYDVSGRVEVNAKLSNRERALAASTMALVGLDRNPSSSPPSTILDRRWKLRYEAAQVATQSLKNLSIVNHPVMRDQIVTTAVAQGFWSIWLTAFAGDTDMTRRLVNAFPGTALHCWKAGKLRRRPGGRC